MNYLTPSDWLVIAIYLAGMIAIGLGLGKGAGTTRDYFLGNKNIPWWGVGLSIVASETSAMTIITIPALAYVQDLAFVQILIGYVLARIILAVVMVPHYFRGEIYSPYQLLTNKFGPATGRLAGGFFLLSGTLGAGVRVYVTSIPIQLYLGVDIFYAILFFVGFALMYSYLGGIKAVIWTDVAQFLFFTFGGLFTVIYIPFLLPGGWNSAWADAAQAGKLHWLNTGFSWAAPFNIWMGFLGATAQVMSSHGADQLIVQRVLTCRSVADGRKALLFSAVIIFPLFLIFLMLGVLLWVYYQQFPLAIPLPENQAGLKQNDYIYPIFIATVIPPVIRGFLIVAIVAAATSSVSGALAGLSSVSTMDFIKTLFRPGRSETYYFRFSRGTMAFWSVMLVGVALASRETTLALNWAFALNGLTSGAMLGGLLLAIATKSRQAIPVITGMLIALGVMTSINIYWRTSVYWPWYTLIGASITIAVATLMMRVLPARAPR